MQDIFPVLSNQTHLCPEELQNLAIRCRHCGALQAYRYIHAGGHGCSEKFHVECACQTTDTTKNMSGPILQHEQNDDDC